MSCHAREGGHPVTTAHEIKSLLSEYWIPAFAGMTGM
jgi:hypothetical protein